VRGGVPILKSDTLKAKLGLSGPTLNRIPGPAPVIPDHEMIRCIGQGSYGEVWLARNAVGTWRAVKVVYRQNFKDARPYEREFAGIQSYEPISRSNEGLIDVLQIGRNDPEGYFYYVMELADAADSSLDREESAAIGSGERTSVPNPSSAGERDRKGYVPKTLSRVIQQRGRLNNEECITLGLTLNLALGYLHRHGLIHRDVKPSNIIFVNGVPKLTDIGLVTDLAGAESFVGTEGFIPPEGPNSPQADLYALGKVLYEASMGKDRKEFPEPFTGLGMDAESKALMELNAVLVRACAPDPKQRYQRAEEMNADLALLHNGESVRDKHALEHRLKVMTRVGTVTVALIVLGVIPYYLAIREARRATALARLEAQQRQRAQTEAAKSQEVAQLLKEMLKSAEPSVALGRDTTMLREILDQTAERIGRDFGNQPEVEAELGGTLGEVYQELGEFKKAESMLRRALKLRIQLLGEENLTVAQSLNDLSPALWNQGNLDEAERLQRRALAIRTLFLGGSNLAVAESLQDLGCILSGQSKMSEAEMMFRQALKIRRQILGNDHVEVADSLSGVANMLNAQGQWADAELMFREALDLDRKLLSPRHPKSAGAVNGLVQALLPQNKLNEAEAEAREALVIQKQMLGADHPLVAGSLTRLARVLQRAGKVAEAKENLEEALAIWSSRFSNQTPGIGETLNALFDILLSEGNHAEAEQIFQRVLTPEALGERPNTSLLRACGTYHARTSQWPQAVRDFSKWIKLEPGNHEAYHALTALCVQTADLEGYRRLCNQIRAQFGSITNDPRICDRMAKDCLVLPPQSDDLSIEARLANAAVTFNEASAASAWFQFCKGLAEYRLGHFSAAAEWIQKVLLKVGEGSTRDVEAYMVLAMAEQRLNQPDEARKTLALGTRLSARRLPPLASGDIGDGWIDWIFARALIQEATTLIEGSSTTTPSLRDASE
jgi:eukaryotic-like serine/threonine-protein kinase